MERAGSSVTPAPSARRRLQMDLRGLVSKCSGGLARLPSDPVDQLVRTQRVGA